MDILVGNRYRAPTSVHGPRDAYGAIGVCVDVAPVCGEETYLGLEFEKDVGGHDASGYGKPGHCWYYPISVLEDMSEWEQVDRVESEVKL